MVYRFVAYELLGNKICHPQIRLFDIRIILGWLILRNSRRGRSSENQVKVTLCKRHLHYKGNFHLSGCLPPCTRKRGWSYLWKLLSVQKVMISICITTLPWLTVLFLGASITESRQPQHLPSLAEGGFRVVGSATLVSYLVFLSLSHIYRKYMLLNLFVFLLLICLVLQGCLS